MNYAEGKVHPHTFPDLFSTVFRKKQTYTNLLYLFVSFFLSILYFVFLLSGLIASVSSTFILGVPVLFFMVYAWQKIAEFERITAIAWLGVNIRPLFAPFPPDTNLWERFRARITNPAMWKSLAFLLAKCPLGIFSFTIMVSLFSVTIGLVCT